MIPISQPLVGDLEKSLVMQAMESGWISSKGEFLDQFEARFADFCGVKHCVSTSNGTVALHLALVTAGIGPGDEVLVPDLTFAATANVVLMTGAKPVYVDVTDDSWCMDVESARAKITANTRAIIPVHLYGQVSDVAALMCLAEQHNLFILEDAAEAHGARQGDRRVGSLGHCGAFSFFGNKIVTTGEGGCLTTNCDETAAKARRLRDHGMDTERRYWHAEMGYNYRMTNLQAALGVAQMQQFSEIESRRRRIHELYQEMFSNLNLKMNSLTGVEGYSPVNWLTCVRIPGISRDHRDQLIEALRDAGVETRPFFYPLTSMPAYKGESQSRSAKISQEGVCLPTFTELTDDQVRYVGESFTRLLNGL